MSPIFLGCAGWNLPREHWPRFSPEGTHLRRYGLGLNAVEINSSFYRPHRPQTYARWAQSVPAGFRFSVKVPRQLTHELRLQGGEAQLDEFLGQCGQLGAKLGCLLVQLPPSLSYEPVIASAFFGALRERFAGDVVLEPRHDSWLAAEPLLLRHRIGRVAADPASSPEAIRPPAGRGCAIGACTAPRASITAPTRLSDCEAWRNGCRPRHRRVRRPGAFSTTPPAAMR